MIHNDMTSYYCIILHVILLLLVVLLLLLVVVVVVLLLLLLLLLFFFFFFLLLLLGEDVGAKRAKQTVLLLALAKKYIWKPWKSVSNTSQATAILSWGKARETDRTPLGAPGSSMCGFNYHFSNLRFRRNATHR